MGKAELPQYEMTVPITTPDGITYGAGTQIEDVTGCITPDPNAMIPLNEAARQRMVEVLAAAPTNHDAIMEFGPSRAVH